MSFVSLKKKVQVKIDLYRKRQAEKVHNNYMAKNLKKLQCVKQLTAEQEEEIQNFYQKLIGKKVCLDSHRYFYSRTGTFSKEYVPTYLYHVDLINKANMLSYRDALADKNMCDILFPEIKHPRTILKNRNGYFYMYEKPVSREEAVRQCQNLQNMLIKPSLDKHGNGVKSLEVENGITNHDGATIEQVFEKYSMNFQIQERLKQHERMAALNPTSVNTIRLLTYRSGMEVLLVYAVVRIGREGQVIDNQCAGGLSTYIDKDGNLGSFSYGGYNEDNVIRTDTGIKLGGYHIPSFDKAVEAVKKLHFNLPFFDLVGWDIAIDDEGEPVMLEWNANTGLSQSAFGPGFGEYTERIIKELWPRENKYNHNW